MGPLLRLVDRRSRLPPRDSFRWLSLLCFWALHRPVPRGVRVGAWRHQRRHLAAFPDRWTERPVRRTTHGPLRTTISASLWTGARRCFLPPTALHLLAPASLCALGRAWRRNCLFWRRPHRHHGLSVVYPKTGYGHGYCHGGDCLRGARHGPNNRIPHRRGRLARSRKSTGIGAAHPPSSIRAPDGP